MEKKEIKIEMKEQNLLSKENSFYGLYTFKKLNYEKELYNAKFEIKLTGRELAELWNAVKEFKKEHQSILPAYYLEHPINTILDTINKIFGAKQIGMIDEENEDRKFRIIAFAENLLYEAKNLKKD